MNANLQHAITGAAVTVTLGGKEYPLAYPMEAVILYKRETAVLDRARNATRPKLSRAQIREMAAERRKLMAEAEELRPQTKKEEWDDDKFARFQELQDDASELKAA